MLHFLHSNIDALPNAINDIFAPQMCVKETSNECITASGSIDNFVSRHWRDFHFLHINFRVNALLRSTHSVSNTLGAIGTNNNFPRSCMLAAGGQMSHGLCHIIEPKDLGQRLEIVSISENYLTLFSQKFHLISMVGNNICRAQTDCHANVIVVVCQFDNCLG